MTTDPRGYICSPSALRRHSGANVGYGPDAERFRYKSLAVSGKSLDARPKSEQSLPFKGWKNSWAEKGLHFDMVMALNDLLWEPDEGWREQAACGGADAAIFFPAGEDEALVGAARAICARCPVSDECLRYALATNQTEGIWGGMTGSERRRLRRRIRDRQRRAS